MARRVNNSLVEYQLTAKEIIFAEALIAGATQADAIVKAGYSDKSPQTAAFRLLQNPGVKKYIEDREKQIAEIRRKELEVDDLWITAKFKEILDRCMQAKPVMRYDAEAGEMRQLRDDETGEPLFIFDSAGAIKAAENLAKHIGYYEMDNRQKAPVIKITAVQNNIINYFTEDEENLNSGLIAGEARNTD